MIYLQCNLTLRKWECNFDPYETGPNILIGFYNGSERIVFSDLSFGYQLFVNDNLIKENDLPIPGNKIIKTDQNFIDSETLDPDQILIRDADIRVNIWCNESGIYTEDTFNLTMPSDAVEEYEEDLESDGETNTENTL